MLENSDNQIAQEVLPVSLEEEMRQSYLDYSMSVIIGRALPDVRDGLKPVHRRVLYAMNELRNDWNKPYKKSARVVGDVIGKYHPHGDTAVYDAIVRMAQPFSLRYMLVDGQGNFGSVDGDPPAAMRYTEVRMSKMAHSLLADLDKETVDLTPNYDESEYEPSVLPTRIPSLLVNGSSGIAVGMATNIPPHNINEVVSATIALIDNQDLDIKGLMEYLPGPDLPTAAIINGAKGIHSAYHTGRGKIYMRAKAHEEEVRKGRNAIVITEIPYQLNKGKLLEKIGSLIREKKLEGVAELRDESDKDGIRVVFELKRDALADVVLNNLYQQTALESVFGINMVAIVDGRPKLLNLKQILEEFIRHRREVVTRRTLFELRKARNRAHILEGLAIALTNIDPVIALIKASKTPAVAKEALLEKLWPPGVVTDMLARAGAEESRPEGLEAEYGMQEDGYKLSPAQAQAILELRLHRLTGLEQDKILNEFKELLDFIVDLLDIVNNPDRLLKEIRNELEEIKEQFGDERRTEIQLNQQDLSIEDLINEEDMVVTLSHGGYVKSQPLTDYSAQRRGGKGKSATNIKDEDFVEKLTVASTHDTILCFSTRGRLYWLKVYELPQASRAARGRPINNLLPLQEGERITAILSLREYAEDQFIFMATANGTVKKTSLQEFSRPRNGGKIALELAEGDTLVGVALTDGQQDIMLFATNGKSVRFKESDVRMMGRLAKGVRGIRLADQEKVTSLIVPSDGEILTVTENGFGKRTKLEEYAVKGRGGKGIISIQTSERNGAVIGSVEVEDSNEIMLISDRGTMVRTRVSEVTTQGRNTQGVTLIKVADDERLIGIEKVAESVVDDLEDEGEEQSDNV